jgi:histone-binding protein RBBP4
MDALQVEEEYKVWKKNAPFMYDLVMTHALEWSSLTVQWLPEVREGANGADDVHRLILGTHTSGEVQNYLLVAETKLPSPDAEIEAKAYDDKGDVGGFGASPEKIKIVCRMAHEGEVNKARYMPQNSNIIATKSPDANVYVFDTMQHADSMSVDAPVFAPAHTCKGHSAEGFGLCWNPHSAGQLLSGSDDHLVCLWDVTSARQEVIHMTTACTPFPDEH